MKTITPNTRFSCAHHQGGIALIVALVLLVAVTLLGISGIRNTSMQERMSGNMYDRSLAMQAAESALRAAEAALTANPTIGVICPGFCPDDAFDPGHDGNWINVGTEFRVNDDLAAGVPQYYIQLIDQILEPSRSDGSANEFAYGSPTAASITSDYYRITARSSAPSEDHHRAIVVLQTTVKLER